MRYETDNDISLRLKHSVVMYNKAPVQVMDVVDKGVVVVQGLITGDVERVDVNLLDLQPSHAPLGYVVHPSGVYLAMRKPVRKFKQGLTQENLIIRKVLEEKRGEPRMPERSLRFNSPEIGRTMLGMYDSVGEAFQQVRKGKSKLVPFHRDWAVADYDDELSLVYRGEVVGFVGDASVKLLPERFYLKEGLELCLK